MVGYLPLAHVEFASNEGRIQYVTYSHETGFLQTELRLVEVELGAL